MWDAGAPELYDLTLELVNGIQNTVDTVESYYDVSNQASRGKGASDLMIGKALLFLHITQNCGNNAASAAGRRRNDLSSGGKYMTATVTSTDGKVIGTQFVTSEGKKRVFTAVEGNETEYTLM